MADETELPTKIGYKSPPIEHRFKKGQSGNPKGRPRKSPARQAHREVWVTGLSADEVLLDEAYRPVQVREADEVKSMSALTAVYRSLATAAVKGDRFARKLFTESVRNAEARKQAELREMIDIVSSYKERCYEAFRIADARGVPRPEFVPHPDDCVMGANGMPDIVGPFDEARKAAWDEARRRIADADGDIAEFRRMAARNPDLAVLFHDAIMREERLKRTLDFMMPDEATRRRHGYEKPTVATARAFTAALARRYRLFDELSPDEQERALRELVPVMRHKQKMLSSGE
jgi:hypothetical protein